jgi:uncharacterized protein with PIN domain
MRFECDGMLVKLARYLRCVGYDATWDLEAPLARRIDRADRESRIFLTRSRRLEHQERLPRQLVVLASEDPVQQVRELVAAIGLDPQVLLFTRCIRCNVELVALAKDDALRARVHAATFASYAHFYGCPACGTVFWKGSHVRNTCRKLGLRDASE